MNARPSPSARRDFDIIKDEIQIIEIDRHKTGELSIIPVLPDLQEVIDSLSYFQKEYESDRLFPVRRFQNDRNLYNTDYQLYRTVLRLITEKIKCPEPITSHKLRHSFGMIMMNTHNYSAEEVALMMGHEDYKTTLDNYVRVDRKRIKEATKRIKLLGQ